MSGSAQVAEFDRIASLYDDSIPPHVTQHYVDKRVRYFQAVFAPGSRLLDVGCGTGRLAAALVRAGFRVTGIDPSLGMLQHARPRGIVATCASAGALPWPEGAFDGVYSVAVMHQIGRAHV